MNNLSVLLKKLGLLSAIVFLAIASSQATTYTATASGSWSSTTTWAGGLVPPANSTADAITVNSGVNVSLDNNVTVTGGSLNVLGTLSSNTYGLTFGALTTVSGSGSMMVDNISYQATAIGNFTGSVVVNTYTNSVASLQLAGSTTVNQTLELEAGTLALTSLATLTLANNATVMVNGGLLSQGSGAINFGSNYNVVYETAGSTGIELTGTSLGNVTVNTTGSVNLANSMTVNGTLTLTSGTLNLNGNNLTIAGNVAASGSGTIQSSSSSNLTLSGSGSGSLNFIAGSAVNTLTVNVGTGNQAQIGGSLNVTGNLQLSSGSLNINNSNFTLSGSVAGSGTLSGGSAANLTVTGTSNLTGNLSFSSSAQSLNNLTISLGSGNSANLGSNVSVGGNLILSGGSSLSLGSHTLTVNGSLTGSGTLVTTSSSGLNISTASGNTTITTSPTIGTLVVNSGSGSVSIGNDLTIAGTLGLQTGTLVLNGNNLSIIGDIAAGGSGGISSTSASNISLTGTSGITGALAFSAGTSSVNNLTLNIGSGNQASIAGSLRVVDTLQLTSGTLSFSNSNLTLSGSLSGSGTLSGNSYSNLTVTRSGNFSGNLNFASGGQLVENLTINLGTGNSATLASDLSVGGALTLTGASMLNVGSNTITLAGTSSGTGSLNTTSGSGIVVNTSSNGNLTLSTSGTVGALTVNSGSGSVSLSNNTTVSTTLNLQSGSLVLNGYDLTISGNIAGGGSGSISSTSSSSVAVTGSSSLTGALTFAAGSDTVNNFNVGIGSSHNSLSLGSNLLVAGTLGLNGGVINTGTNSLTVNTSGSVSGGDTSSYVASTGTGYLSLNLSGSSATWTTFHVGTSAHYAPVALQLNTGSQSSDIHVSATTDVLAHGTTGIDISASQPMVAATYTIEPAVSTGVNLNMQLMWSSSMEVNGFIRTGDYISHYTNGAWDTDISASATAQANGMFSLQRNNITSFSPFAVFDQGTATGITETSDLQFEMYPNPATDNLMIRSTSASQKINIQILSIDGRVLNSYTINGDNGNISLSNLAAGNYLVKMNDGSTTVTRKVTKI